MTLTLEIPGTPPSLNTVGSRGHWRQFHGYKKAWEMQIGVALLAECGRFAFRTPVVVRAVLRFPANRSRDEGNYRSILEKSTGDALVKGRWIPDDTPEFYRFEGLSFSTEKGKAWTTLHFDEPSPVRTAA